jgi:hypothetical protein
VTSGAHITVENRFGEALCETGESADDARARSIEPAPSRSRGVGALRIGITRKELELMNREQRRKVLPLTRTVRLSDLLPSPVRREPDPAWRADIEVIRTTFADVKPMTTEEWEEGFCRDLHPEREIAMWVGMVATYRRIITRRSFTLRERKEIVWLMVGHSLVMRPVDLLAGVTVLDRNEADSILREIGGAS